ncbi:MAG: hypothetical protein KZQ99_05045 [Candidatus Thiodiazotropha sp. (ex Dulcina madagascariensis)]|nr:hypothetical protein [Candidatus Thiodiazotropha sp. (ex Dulcina madagascariensis)]
MKQNLGLKILSHVMRWDDDRSREEFAWLKLMSRLKYDGYQDFLAGARFIESLITWLQQFESGEREIAYQYIRKKLVYIGPSEMQRLVENFYPEYVQRRVVKKVAGELNIPTYSVWTNQTAQKQIEDFRRKTLFMGLSDGARTDILRRANVGILSNEQVVVTTQLDKAKWKGLLKDLKDDCGDDAKFSTVYLIDDFIASGTTLIRYDDETEAWIGKLKKFWDSIHDAESQLGYGSLFEEDWHLYVHHYLASDYASKVVSQNYEKAMSEESSGPWFPYVEFTYGYVLPVDLPITKCKSEPFLNLVNKYYDPILENDHSEKSGVRSVKYGYKECALPLVLDHNTPNNSLPILWAETEGENGAHAMRSLFRRRQRHG